jgi:ankyrin repeat protein
MTSSNCERYLSNYIRNYFVELQPTVLHVAVATIETKILDLDIIQLFLRLGADPNAKDDNGQTPLHILAGRRVAYLDANSPIFKALVDS